MHRHQTLHVHRHQTLHVLSNTRCFTCTDTRRFTCAGTSHALYQYMSNFLLFLGYASNVHIIQPEIIYTPLSLLPLHTHTQVPSLGVPKGGIRSIERQGEGDTLHPCQTAAPGGLHPATEGVRRLHQGASVCLSVWYCAYMG